MLFVSDVVDEPYIVGPHGDAAHHAVAVVEVGDGLKGFIIHNLVIFQTEEVKFADFILHKLSDFLCMGGFELGGGFEDAVDIGGDGALLFGEAAVA